MNYTTARAALGRISVVIGTALILAGIVDLLAYTWGRNSPWPWWVNVAYMLVGVLLLFPERLGLGVGWAMEILPWFRSRSEPPRDDPE